MGVGVEYTTRVARQLDSIITANYPEVVMLSTSAGQADASNAFAAMRKSGLNMINYQFRLVKPRDRKRSIFEISDGLRKDMSGIPEIRQYTVSPGGQSSGSTSGGSNIALKIFGYDFTVTGEAANDLKTRLAAIEGTRDVQISREDMRPEFNVVFDRNRLTYYGLNSATAATYVRNRINGLTASKYREEGDEYDIIVRYGETHRQSLDDVRNIIIYNNVGKGIRLSDVATVEEVYAPPTIERENRQRIVTVSTTLAPGYALGTVLKEVNSMLENYRAPEGVSIDVGGTVEDQGESFSSIMSLFALIVLLVYIVMATQFESFRMPFIIMFTLPFAFTGVFLALFLTSTPLSLIALIGAIMLVGIVVKNGIVMVDFTNLMRERGQSINQAVITAGKSRLRPVLMTSLTTILGMLPLALGTGEGSETWQPMGIAVIGGLTFSTMLTLIVIPVVYSIFGASGVKKERKRLAEAHGNTGNQTNLT